MGYEGYSQFLCKKGHYWTLDCYEVQELSKNICPICKAPAVWDNIVDITNGSWENGVRIDGYKELVVNKEKKCKECGQLIEVTYKIPK